MWMDRQMARYTRLQFLLFWKRADSLPLAQSEQ